MRIRREFTFPLLLAVCAPARQFEAASIRRNPGVSTNTSISTSGGRLTITNASVKTLIRNA